MERDYTLYQHFCKVTKKSYIGITKQEPKKRWKAYGKGYRPNTHFGNAIRKYGWDNFEHIILATNLTEEEAKQLEQTCIVAFETYGKYGYNSTFGGDGTLGFTKVISQEQREKISKANTGKHHTEETKAKISKNNKGKCLSEKSRKQISETLKQKYKAGIITVQGPKKAKKVGQYTLDGKLVKIYNSITETKNYGYNTACVSMCCSGKRNNHKGYIWKYM